MSDQPTTFFEDLSGSLQYIAYFRFWVSNSRSFYPDSAQASSTSIGIARVLLYLNQLINARQSQGCLAK